MNKAATSGGAEASGLTMFFPGDLTIAGGGLDGGGLAGGGLPGGGISGGDLPGGGLAGGGLNCGGAGGKLLPYLPPYNGGALGGFKLGLPFF